MRCLQLLKTSNFFIKKTMNQNFKSIVLKLIKFQKFNVIFNEILIIIFS